MPYRAALGSAPRNRTPADQTARAYEGGTPRLYDRRAIPPHIDDLAAQHAIREARVIPCAPIDCHYHRGPARENCQRCGQPWAWYARGIRS